MHLDYWILFLYPINKYWALNQLENTFVDVASAPVQNDKLGDHKKNLNFKIRPEKYSCMDTDMQPHQNHTKSRRLGKNTTNRI